MRLIQRGFAVCICLIFFFSCSPSGPLFPSDAFYQLSEAYYINDPDIVISLLSKKSRNEIKQMIKKFKAMSASTRKRIARVYGLKEGRLYKMSERDFVLLCLYLDKNKDSLRQALRHKIVGVDRKNKKAVVRVENGMKLIFVKEGPYWKFDMNFSSLGQK